VTPTKVLWINLSIVLPPFVKLGLRWNYEECKRFLDILMMWSNRIHFSRSAEMGMDALLLSGFMEVWITKSFISPYK
jgi:hypothetical protein